MILASLLRRGLVSLTSEHYHHTMTRFTAHSYSFFQHPWFLCAASISAVVQIIIWVFEAAGKLPKIDWVHTVITHGVFVMGGLVLFGILLISGNFQRVKRSLAKIHDLNHLYRNTLAETSAKLLILDGATRDEDVKGLLARTEFETIDRVTSIIAAQFQLLFNRPVVVTFWKYDDDQKACVEQETSANGTDSTRPFRQKERYLKRHNSVFCDNRDKKGKCCHFYSPDVSETSGQEFGYQDERPNYLEFYKSVLCVPIRFCFQTRENEPTIEDLVGYLQVDTASRYRLNNAEHLYLLSAYADQLYNFLSLVRRNFILS
jgi:hypothetical protein